MLHNQFSLFLPVFALQTNTYYEYSRSVSVSYCTYLVDITLKQKLAL